MKITLKTKVEKVTREKVKNMDKKKRNIIFQVHFKHRNGRRERDHC